MSNTAEFPRDIVAFLSSFGLKRGQKVAILRKDRKDLKNEEEKVKCLQEGVETSNENDDISTPDSRNNEIPLQGRVSHPHIPIREVV